MQQSDKNESPSNRSRVALLRWPVVLIVLAVLGFLAVQHAAHRLSEEARDWRERTIAVASNALTQTKSIPDRFQQGTITQTFIAAIPTISASKGGLLEVAKADAVEIFRSADTRTLAWDWINLGTTFTEIKVPVTYRYHLRIADDWHLDRSGQTCIVFAPKIRASQPPAIHTDRLQKRSRNGWARFNREDQLEDLQRSLTPRLSEYAEDPRHMAMVRDRCRQTVAEFVQAWLLKEDQWREDRFHSVKVLFPDEVREMTRRSQFSMKD